MELFKGASSHSARVVKGCQLPTKAIVPFWGLQWCIIKLSPLARTNQHKYTFFLLLAHTYRRWGVVGILGHLTRRWIDDCLPAGAADRCTAGNATLLVTTLPLLKTHPISCFHSDSDLKDVVMASAHIPVVVDWRLWVNCRWRPCVDGGLWWLLKRSTMEYTPRHAASTLIISPFDDPHVVKVMYSG